ncbi:MAG TPA: peptide deformylase [Candidatus Sulfotelmatobacter sp.]|jgi:peptide deformylase|nr:peptide deformylase [Candidatus Sulfotelmatobacter sp.]
MAILDIVRLGHPALKSPAVAVADPTASEIAVLAQNMAETLEESGGVGLAAPQVGVGLRLVMFFVPPTRGGGEPVPLTVLINPEITPLDDETAEAYEGCLSIPGMTGMVPRWKRIRYRGVGLDGQAIDRIAEDFHARVVQHECDHLDGRVYLSRMTGLDSLTYVDELLRARGETEPREEERPE